mmetsp:Transcript_9594/g.27333  ORF Transcript_9594/g.27333 Transcript_9594/m.27333 type:complete len:332 (-) Transcript_9594:267-1262(-)
MVGIAKLHEYRLAQEVSHVLLLHDSPPTCKESSERDAHEHFVQREFALPHRNRAFVDMPAHRLDGFAEKSIVPQMKRDIVNFRNERQRREVEEYFNDCATANDQAKDDDEKGEADHQLRDVREQPLRQRGMRQLVRDVGVVSGMEHLDRFPHVRLHGQRQNERKALGNADDVLHVFWHLQRILGIHFDEIHQGQRYHGRLECEHAKCKVKGNAVRFRYEHDAVDVRRKAHHHDFDAIFMALSQSCSVGRPQFWIENAVVLLVVMVMVMVMIIVDVVVIVIADVIFLVLVVDTDLLHEEVRAFNVFAAVASAARSADCSFLDESLASLVAII